MRKLFMFIVIFTLSLVAREEIFAVKECPAFNNMKHTKNTHNILLDTATKYTILRHHKGQALILLKGEQPAQRWVDNACFSEVNFSKEMSLNTDLKTYNNQKISQKNLLALSWHNAFCETHRSKKECKRPRFSFSDDKYRERHFVLHGLWPQPKNRTYCDVESKFRSLDKHRQWHRLPPLNLSDEVKKDLSSVMPGFASNLHKHEWIKHGTCYGTNANRYYQNAIDLVRQVNDSKVGNFFRQNIGKRVTLQQIRAVFNRSFGAGTGKRVELKCKKGLVTELWLHLGARSDDLATLLKQGKQTRSRCQGGLIDKAGF